MEKTDISIKSLIEKVRHGELLLPEMQRRYVWRATRVRDLLDSLYRGYPSGIILVWETDEDVETVSLATEATIAPTTGQKQLLLDGQQRITSLVAILEGQPVKVRNKRKPIELLFNLEHPEGGPIEITEVEDDLNSLVEEEDEDADEYDVQEKLQK